MYTAGLEGVGLADDSPVIADQIDNEKRPQLAPGRSGWWEGNLVREELCRPTSICSENREDTWALRGGGP